MLLEVKHVTGTSKEFRLQDICFSLEEGYLMGIAGKNGAGKTTLFRYFMEPEKLYEGEILLDGLEIKKDRIAFLNQIGFVSEENIFFENYTIEQNAELLSDFYESWDQGIFEKMTDEMGIPAGRKAGALSRGERVKFQLAFAAAHKPRLYLMDEPTAGMDPIFRKEFFRIMYRLFEEDEIAVVMTTHIQEEMETRMDVRAVMEAGRMVELEHSLG